MCSKGGDRAWLLPPAAFVFAPLWRCPNATAPDGAASGRYARRSRECLIWSGPSPDRRHVAMQGGKFNKRWREEWEEGRERGTGRTFTSSLDDLKAWGTKESLSMASMSFILRTCSSRETPSETHVPTEESLWTKARTRLEHTQIHGYPLSSPERGQISFGSGWGDCMLSFSTMLCDIHNMRYLIFPYFNLGIRKEGFLLSQGHRAKPKRKKTKILTR